MRCLPGPGHWEGGDAERGCPQAKAGVWTGMLSLGGACRRDIQAAKPTGVPAALIS